MISPEKWQILTPLQQLPKNVGDLGKLIGAKKSCPKSNKSPNLVTLVKLQQDVGKTVLKTTFSLFQ